ncbi:hypothetical protein C2G38_568984 [Gigaspora rosea]|uniref:Uncharacterized protein n=1 Tax=Gigaspora rosea TaxID=44941 RepID=A0A397VR41_9GLOM|nr:hypothetical protein C2G38_568984 [Gigaspora rosea]
MKPLIITNILIWSYTSNLNNLVSTFYYHKLLFLNFLIYRYMLYLFKYNTCLKLNIS